MANSVDPDQIALLLPDQTAPLGAVWSGSALFAQAYLSENLGSYGIRIFNGCEVWIENSVMRVTAEQLSRVTEFSIRTKQPLWILFLVYFSFDKSF